MQTKMSGSPLQKNGVGAAALGSAAKGATMGAKIGSFIPIPGVGTAIGAGVGALVGGIAGGVKKKKENQAIEEQQDLLLQQQQIADAAAENKESMQEYNTGVDLAAQALSSPATMKKLTAVGMSYSPMKMKMKEAQMGGKMMEISGASTLPERY